MKKYILLVVVAFLMAGALVISQDKDNQPRPASQDTEAPAATQEATGPNTIVMSDDGYEPTNLSVNKGDEVTFVNRGSDDHWPASDNHPTHQKFSKFDPKRPITPNDSWTFIFNEAGSYGYHDHLFPDITGTITVRP